MSHIEQGIIDAANITLGGTFKFDNLDKIKQVMVSCKIQKKQFTPLILKKLLKRYQGDEPTEEVLIKLHNDADLAFTELTSLKKAERDNILTSPQTLPDYISEKRSENGDPTGEYELDCMKYSDFLRDHFHLCNLDGNLFVYDGTTGTYRRHVNQVETHTRDVVKKFGVSGSLTGIEREVNTNVKSMGCVRNYPFVGKFGTIHVLNGCLDIKTGMLSPATHDMMYDYRIETNYREFPDGTPELDAFLGLYGTEEPIAVLAKAIWQRAFHDTLKEFTVFIGRRDTGKTTMAEFVQFTIDGSLNENKNVCRTLLQDLTQRFGYAALEGKLLNVGDDLPDMFVKNASKLNELVGSVVRHVEKKGIDPYDTTVTTYHLFTANNLPPLDDDDNVIWGKIRLVECKNVVTIPKVPRTTLYTETLREQLLYNAVKMAVSYTVTPYKNDQTEEEVRAKWHESTTDIDAFISEYLKFDMGKETSYADIKAHYEGWCNLFGKTRYIKYLNKRLQPYFRKTNARNVYCLALVEPKDDAKGNGQQPIIGETPKASATQ